MGKEKILGIDLGTTNSCISVIEGGKATVISNSEGQRTTPSVVHITSDGERIVGDAAKKQSIVKPKETISSIKTHMGEKYTVNIHSKDYSPQEISAMTLSKLKKDAESYLGGEVKKAVITVPAYFTDAQRQATKDAGKIAGLEVMRIINEPTAAALAYGIDKDKDGKILVFDFGGGTFDVSVLELDDGVFEVKSTAGDNKLGGDNVDNVLMDYVFSEFKKENAIDLKADPQSNQRVKLACEKAKIELSSKMEVEINEPFISAGADGPKHLNMKITRAKFNDLISSILEKLKGPTNQAIKDSGYKTSEIQKIILVGGSTRIPAVVDLVKEISGKDADKSVNPDEAVALGAAIQGGVLAGDVKDILLLDVTPLTLSIETLGGVGTPMIEKNTTIPTKKTQVFSTAADNQTAVTVRVAQGERSMFNDNKLLGSFNLEGIPPAQRGVPQIEITYDIDANGILNVSAKELASNVDAKITISSSGNLSEEEIEKMKADAEKHKEEDEKRKKEIEVVNNAESMVFQTKKTLEENKKNVDQKKVAPIMTKINDLDELLKAENKNIDLIEKTQKEIEEMSQGVFQEMYAKQAEAGQSQGAEKKEDKVVDAEVKEESKKEDKK
jgi:molecular chaperone DnaK